MGTNTNKNKLIMSDGKSSDEENKAQLAP